LLDIFSLSQRPRYYNDLFSRTDKFLEKTRKFVDGVRTEEKASKTKFDRVPPNATIREERVNCKKYRCMMCPHGPYYYAYWKEKGKLRKKYIGTKYDETWKKRHQTVLK
jgi:hypothetical protein